MNLWLPRGRIGRRVFGVDMCTLLYLKCITNKILLYSMGNSAQCFVAVTWMWIRGESLEENGYIHTYVWVTSLSFWNCHNVVNRLWVLSYFGHVQLCNPMDCSHQAPLAMEFSRLEYWSGLPWPPPGGLPHPGFETKSLMSLALTGGLFKNTSTT